MSSECIVCKRQFASHTAMIMHAENAHGRGGVYAGVSAWERSRGQAGEITTGRDGGDVQYYIEDSFYNYDSETWECPHCSRGFGSKNSLLRHMQSGVHEVKRYACNDCQREFSTLTSLSQHLTNTGHSQRENRLVHTMIHDAQRVGTLMLTNGSTQLPAEATLFFDGGARPNPGLGGCGWHLVDNVRSGEITRGGASLGHGTTNNMAEYSGLINGLKVAYREGIRRLHVKGDSELVIRQMTGEYRVSSELLTPYHRSAMSWVQNFQSVTFQHIGRSENYIADGLASDYIG